MKKVEDNKTYIGVVEDIKDPSKAGRVRVRVMDIFDDMEVEDIPWASPWKDINGNEFNIPEVGKVLIVVFEKGDVNKPEFIFSDHYNINLENKLKSLSDSDYSSMKSLIFDHKTQIYVNDDEGLKIDHKYNNINITENSVDINLKDNNRNVNIGDSTAAQQAILGNNWMDWFDEFVNNLMGQMGGPFLGNFGAPVVPNPAFISVLQKYKALRDPKFLSHHVNIVDNSKITTVKNTDREDEPQVGDVWNSTVRDNELTTKSNDDFKPVDGPKKEYDDEFKSPPVDGDDNSVGDMDIRDKVSEDIPASEKLSEKESNPTLDKLIRFLESKNYEIYDDVNILNIVALRTKDDGIITNKFDDTLYVFFRKDNGNWELVDYPITTTPGYIPKKKILPKNVAILALGQYIDQCELSNFGNDDSYKCLKFNQSTIHRNDVVDRYNYNSEMETGDFALYIHRSIGIGSSEDVYNYSEGSQVFKGINHYKQFIKLCEKQSLKKSLFTYTLCRKSDFDNFI